MGEFKIYSLERIDIRRQDSYFLFMEILWNNEKNKILLETRGVSFEMILKKIIEDDFIGPEINPARNDQLRIVVKINQYPYVVPFVLDNDGNWFLKTIYPSRKEKENNLK